MGFRQNFIFPIKSKHAWFPGHMRKGLRQMQNNLPNVDCVIEVHDARIPISGRNLQFFSKLTGSKPHILVLNKADLVDNNKKNLLITKRIKNTDSSVSEVIFTNCSGSGRSYDLKKVLPTAIDLIETSHRYNREDKEESDIMVIGIPNVGKSSLINIIRRKYLNVSGKVAAVGAKPGMTRAVQTKIRVNNDPLVYFLDTPGIMMPSISDMHMGIKLALCGTLQDHLVGEEEMADYLLYYLNKIGNFKYVNFLGIDEPSDDINLVLAKCAVNKNMILKVKSMMTKITEEVPDLPTAARYFIKGFRCGKIGKVNLDDDLIVSNNHTIIEV